MVKMLFEGKNLANCDFWTKSDPYLILSRPKKGDHEFKKVRKTETIKNNLNPKWKLLYISLSELCDSDLSLPLRLTVFDEDRNSHDDLIGEAESSLQQLINCSVSGGVIVLKLGEKKRGELYIRECEIEDCSNDVMTRKLSQSQASYPERKSSTASMFGHSQPPSHAPSCVDGQYQQPQQQMYSSQHQLPQLPPAQPHYPPMQPQYPTCLPQYDAQQTFPSPAFSHGQPPMQPGSQMYNFPAIPEDPTDTRPQSIWINR